jgi:hypothetical protein
MIGEAEYTSALLLHNAKIHAEVVEKLKTLFHSRDSGPSALWKLIPYQDYFMPVKLKALTIDDIPAITLQERVVELNKDRSIANQTWMLKTMEDYCKKVMQAPTYDEAIDLVAKKIGRTPEGERAELDRIFKAMKRMPEGPAKKAKKAELEELSLKVGYFLPFNFMKALAFWCEGLTASEIKDIKPRNLIDAYKKAKKYGKGKEAADFVGEVFTPQGRRELNADADRLYNTKHPDKRGSK